MTSIVDGAKEWLVGVAVKKGVKAIVAAIAAFLTARLSTDLLAQWGVAGVDWTKFQEQLTLALLALITIAMNWAKVKLGVRWLVLLAGLAFMATGSARADSAYFKAGPLELDVPFKTAGVVYMYDFRQAKNLVGGETPLLCLWGKVEGTVGVVTSLEGQGAPFVGGNILLGNVLDQWVTLPDALKIGGFGGYDFRTENAIYGLKASIRLWQ